MWAKSHLDGLGAPGLVDLEIGENSDQERRERIRHSLPRHVQVVLGDQTVARARELEALGFLGMDAKR